MPFTLRFLFAVAVTSMTACVPDVTDEADFYALCSKHVQKYIDHSDKTLPFDAARHSADYTFRKSGKNARITTFVRSSEETEGQSSGGHEQIRSCSFKLAGNGWALE